MAVLLLAGFYDHCLTRVLFLEKLGATLDRGAIAVVMGRLICLQPIKQLLVLVHRLRKTSLCNTLPSRRH